MKYIITIVTIIIILLVPISTTTLIQITEDSIDNIPPSEGFRDIPPETLFNVALTAKFSANKGQIQDDDLLYYALGVNFSVGFGQGWISFKVDDGDRTSVFRRIFVDCNDVTPMGVGSIDERSSYFIGKDPDGWVKDARNYRELHYINLYNGIDLRVYFAGGAIKYEFILEPGSDPSAIVMRHDGVIGLYLSPSSRDLIIETISSKLIDEAPTTYQYLAGEPEIIESSYLLVDNNVHFVLGSYDSSRPLVIDPSINFSTLIGGASYDTISDHFIDGEGSIYVTGYTDSLDFPTTPGVYNRSLGIVDIFVIKMDTNGSTIKYSTFVGGSNSGETAQGIWVDDQGCAYISGDTVGGMDFPTTSGNYSRDLDFASDVVVFKLDANGSDLVFSNVMGSVGTPNHYGRDIYVDNMKNVYVMGYTSSGFFSTAGAFQEEGNGRGDAFVFKLDPSGKQLLLGTNLGGSQKDEAEEMRVDSAGNVYLSGWTRSQDFPVTNNAFCSTQSGAADAFVVKLDANFSTLAYSSYFGGTSNDYGYGIDVDNHGSIYATGMASSGFPTTKGVFDDVINGSIDAFVLKINNTNSLEYSTYIGGTVGEIGYSIKVYDGGCTLVTGYTTSGDFPTTPNAYDTQKAGWRDAFIVKMDSNGQKLLFSSFIGGQEDDYGYEVSVPEGGFVYLSGKTAHNTFPTTQGAYCTTYQGGDWDGFLLRLDIDRPWMFIDSTPNRTTTGDPFQVNLTVRDNTDISEVRLEYWYGSSSSHTRVTMDMTGGTNMNATYVSNLTTPSDSLAKFYYIVHMKDAAGNSNSTGVMSVTVLDNDNPFMTDRTSQIPTTGETFRFAVDVFDNIHMDDVRVVYWFGDRVGEAVNVSMWGTTGTGNGLYDYDAVTIPHDSLRPLHYRFWCNDTSGNWNGTGTFELQVVDNDVPHLGDDLSDGTATTGDPLTFIVNCSDNIGPAVVRVAFWYDEGTTVNWNLTMEALDTDKGGNGSYGLVWSVFPDAVHAIHYLFHVSDGAGNVNLTVERVINVTDNDRPSFHEDSSDSTASTGEDFTYQIMVSDNIDVSDVTVSYWFGEGPATNLSMALQSMQGPGRYVYSLTIHIPTVIPGQLRYQFTATDGSGNINVSQDRAVTIDDSSPPGIIEDLTDGVATTGDPFTFKVVVEDNVGIAGVTVVWRFEESPEEQLDMEPLDLGNPNRPSYFIEVDIPSDGTGSIEYSFQVIDPAGNQWTSSSRTVTILDNDPPTLLEDLTAGTAIKGLTLTISARYEDNIQVDGAWVEYWYGDGEHANVSMTLDEVYSLVVSTPREPLGQLLYRLHAVDRAGNWAPPSGGSVSLYNSPPTIDDVPSWDVVEEEEMTLDISPYISDANDLLDDMVLTCDDDIVTVTGLVLSVYLLDWMPDRTVTVAVSDGEDTAQTSIILKVQNVNDPPAEPEIISPEVGGRFERGDTVSFEASFDDPDLIVGQVLTITWTSDRDGEIGRFTSDAQKIITTNDLSEGVHVVTLTVDDGEETRSTSLKVTVYEDDGNGGITGPTTSLIIIAVIVLIILGTATVIWMKNRNEEPI